MDNGCGSGFLYKSAYLTMLKTIDPSKGAYLTMLKTIDPSDETV